MEFLRIVIGHIFWSMEKLSEIKLRKEIERKRYVKDRHLPSEPPMNIARAHGNIALQWRSKSFSMATKLFFEFRAVYILFPLLPKEC